MSKKTEHTSSGPEPEEKPHRELNFLITNDLKSIEAEMRRIAGLLGKRSVTADDLTRVGRVSAATVANRFGSMRNANLAAGLVPTRDRSWPTTDLLRFLRDVWDLTERDHGRPPRMADFAKYRAPVSAFVVANRFGTWKKALIAASKLPDTGDIPEVWNNYPPRKRLSPHTRFRVFRRDMYQCCICRISGVRLEVDHIVPVSKGGTNTLDNLQALCVPCNRGKGGNLQ